MHYLFLDESIRDVGTGRAMVIASWAVEQDRLSRRVTRVVELLQPGPAPIVKRINSTLETLDALALVARATLDKSLFRYGEKDSTDDITDMARPDAIWSISVGFGVASLIAHFTRMGQHIDTVDVYFDPKSLKSDHATALEGFFRKDLVEKAKWFGAQLGLNVLKGLKIRSFQPIEKPRKNDAPTMFQLGTWVSDRLCSKSDRIREAGGTSRIKVRDISDVVRRTMQQFEGKSFYDN